MNMSRNVMSCNI